jgi:hypothetical protein
VGKEATVRWRKGCTNRCILRSEGRKDKLSCKNGREKEKVFCRKRMDAMVQARKGCTNRCILRSEGRKERVKKKMKKDIFIFLYTIT